MSSNKSKRRPQKQTVSGKKLAQKKQQEDRQRSASRWRLELRRSLREWDYTRYGVEASEASK